MATKLAKIVADFRTSLATKIAVGGTTATLQSATDDDGVSLPAGQYFFTLDGDSSQKEHIVCTLSGTSLSSIKSITRQGVQSSGAVREHRIGSSVTITNFAHIKYINDLLDGTTNLNASTPLEYDGTASITTANQLATKAYADGIAIAGGADASTTVKGISKLSTAPASATEPIAVGTNDTRIPTQDENNALVGTSGTPSTSNKYVTADDVVTTSTADKIVRADGSGKIDDDWLNTAVTNRSVVNIQNLTAGEALTSGNIVRIANASQASDLIAGEQNTTDNSDLVGVNDSNQEMTQSFLVPATFNVYLKKVVVKLKDTGASSDRTMTLMLRTDNAGSPNASTFYTQSFTWNFGTGSSHAITVTLATPQLLTAGTTYWVGVQNTGAYANFYYRYQNTNVYANGNKAYRATSGAFTVASGEDMYFSLQYSDFPGRVYKNTATAQELVDATLGLVTSNYSAGDTDVSVQVLGQVTGMTGLTAGALYYLSDTRGALSTSAGSVSKKIGIADTTTSLIKF